MNSENIVMNSKETMSLNFEQFKSIVEHEHIHVNCDELTFEINSFVGRGSFNCTFLCCDSFTKKNFIVKFFLPEIVSHKNIETNNIDIVPMEYEFIVTMGDYGYTLEHIFLKVPAQIELYNDSLGSYKTSNRKMLELLNDVEINSFIPTTFYEKIMLIETISLNESPDLKNCIMCFEYKLTTKLVDFLANCSNISERIHVVQNIAELLNKLYCSHNLIMLDLKADNFLFKDNLGAGLDNLFIVDWDSFVQLNEYGKVQYGSSINSTEGICPPELLNPNSHNLIGIKSCIYMLGFMLYIAVFQPFVANESIHKPCSPATKYTSVELNQEHRNAFEEMKITQGFINKFVNIINKSYNIAIRSRYSKKDNLNELEQFISDLQILIEIYEHKGVHPEVMLDSVIALKNDKVYETDGFKDELLPEIEIEE